MTKSISIRGARTNNLKNISLDIPRHKLVVITGLSGSGKSSLAFDTIYAEGQRRYLGSLSSYARQYVDLMDKPEVDSITGLTPTIAIDQKVNVGNPRSTVGTVTEIYDLLRLLFARVGIPHCPHSQAAMNRASIDDIVRAIGANYQKQTIAVLAPLIRNQEITDKKIWQRITKAGYAHIRLDGAIINIAEQEIKLDERPHTLEIIIAQIPSDGRRELQRAVKKGLDLSNGLISVIGADKQITNYSTIWSCADCSYALAELEPKDFSFNSPRGACPACKGLGTTLHLDPETIFNEKLSVSEGAIRPWPKNNGQYNSYLKKLSEVAGAYHFSLDTAIKDLGAKQLNVVLRGAKSFPGIVAILEQRYQETDSPAIRQDLEQYMRTATCPDCAGKRLKPEFLAVTVGDKNIAEVSMLTIDAALTALEAIVKKIGNGAGKKITEPIIREIKSKLAALQQAGLGYVAIDRPMATLSGGEAQRVKLATQLSSNLVNVTYVLDEPSIGLHQKDMQKLIATLKTLRDLENTVIVVEHDEATMLAADYLIDVGLGAGNLGGEIIACGTPTEIKNNPRSLTGQYLAHQKHIPPVVHNRPGNGEALKIIGATQNNLKNITVSFPLGKFIALTGVSGSGKSTLMNDILARALNRHFYRAKVEIGAHQAIEGLEHIDKVITIDQSPIGRTPRSNPATYTGAFTYIRDLFAEQPEAKLKNLTPSHFSFNVIGGRCEVCGGDGYTKIDMQFLSDVFVKCRACNGKRYQKDILDIYFRDKNIADVLEMTVTEAQNFFRLATFSDAAANNDAVLQKLDILAEVGLGYIKLGQSATTLSGGEAQRVKLATELSRRDTGRTLYILDEPTTGLHFHDIKRLLDILHKLADKGNTVLIIEHNLDVIKSVDYIIDLGPEGGERGGEIVAQGTPQEVTKNKNSWTGKYLKNVL